MRLFALAATLFLSVFQALPQTPAAALEALLSAPNAARAHWGISVVDAATGATLYAHNEGELFEPASNAKLFTTSAALALLGPTYSMGTRVVAEGTVDASGTLHGDLRLIGGADPTLSGRVYPYAGHTDRSNPPLGGLDALAYQVLASGIHAVDGPVIADDTLFPNQPYGPGWGWDDLQWEYGAAVSALPVNDGVRYLTVTPGMAIALPVNTSWVPDLPSPGSTELVSASTSARGTAPALGVARETAGIETNPQGTLRIYGSLPLGGATVHLALALSDPAQFAGAAFRASLLTAGVGVSGAAVAAHRPSVDTQSFTAETHQPIVLHALTANASSLVASAPTGGAVPTREVAKRRSVPLAEIITVVNKVSQNLHAELLLRLLGRAEGDDGSFGQGARVVRAWATTQAGIAPDDFLLYDGSGLSSKDLVAPRAFTTLLRYSATQPWGPLLRSSLPIAGMDGSLSGRLIGLRGRVEAKTGTLGEVDALSGFLTANSGRVLVFSILCNDHAGPSSRATLDALVQALASSY